MASPAVGDRGDAFNATEALGRLGTGGAVRELQLVAPDLAELFFAACPEAAALIAVPAVAPIATAAPAPVGDDDAAAAAAAPVTVGRRKRDSEPPVDAAKASGEPAMWVDNLHTRNLVDTPSAATAVLCGATVSCIVLADGGVYCFGGTDPAVPLPESEAGRTRRARRLPVMCAGAAAVACYGDTVVAVDTAGQCWQWPGVFAVAQSVSAPASPGGAPDALRMRCVAASRSRIVALTVVDPLPADSLSACVAVPMGTRLGLMVPMAPPLPTCSVAVFGYGGEGPAVQETSVTLPSSAPVLLLRTHAAVSACVDVVNGGSWAVAAPASGDDILVHRFANAEPRGDEPFSGAKQLQRPSYSFTLPTVRISANATDAVVAAVSAMDVLLSNLPVRLLASPWCAACAPMVSLDLRVRCVAVCADWADHGRSARHKGAEHRVRCDGGDRSKVPGAAALGV